MSETIENRPLEATGQTTPQSVSSDAEQEWADLDPKERSKRAREQNKQAQEDAQRAIQEDVDKRLEAQRNAIGQVTSTMPGKTFQQAAEELRETPQPPNPFAADTGNVVQGTPPPQVVSSGGPEEGVQPDQPATTTGGEGAPINPSPPAPGSTTTP